MPWTVHNQPHKPTAFCPATAAELSASQAALCLWQAFKASGRKVRPERRTGWTYNVLNKAWRVSSNFWYWSIWCRTNRPNQPVRLQSKCGPATTLHQTQTHTTYSHWHTLPHSITLADHHLNGVLDTQTAMQTSLTESWQKPTAWPESSPYKGSASEV